MDLNYRTKTVFPFCIHTLSIDNFDQIQDVLIRESYDLKKIDPVGRKLSNRGAVSYTHLTLPTKRIV